MRTALIFLLAGAVLSHSHGGMKTHKCVHDTKFKNFEVKPMPEFAATEARILQFTGTTSGSTGTTGTTGTTSQFGGATSTSGPVAPPPVNDGWHKMRISIDYTYGKQFSSGNPSIAAKYQMSIRLVESVRDYFQRYLTVNYLPYMKFPGGQCYNNKVPAFDRPTDLYITIAPENDPSTDYFAAATSCYMSPRDGRPTIGAYILNLAFLESSEINEYLYFSTFAHEFTHILGFSDNLYPKFVQPGTTTKRQDVTRKITIGSETFNAISMPEVVNYARTYFGCSDIPALPLENNGGDGSAGSHWEKLFLPQEYMNPTVENPGVLSEFTMTFLRATGWYQIGPNAAQRYDWGQNSGCAHFKICPQGPGYCTSAQVSQSVCSSEWMSKVGHLHSRVSATKTGPSHQAVSSSDPRNTPA